MSKGLGAIRAKIGPTSGVDKISSKMYSQYVHLIPHSGPTKSGNEKHETSFFSEYRMYVSLYYNAYL